MPVPTLYYVYSIDLERPALPPDPADCEVLVRAEIGFGGLAGADEFTFTVITPSRLADGATRWGRGYLVVPEFSWEVVERAVQRLLMHADRPTWEAAAGELTKEMRWEFEHHT